MTLDELRQRRAALIAEARQLLEERSQDGELQTEDQEQWDRLMDRADELRAQIERTERLEEAEAQIEARANEPIRPNPGEEREERATGRDSENYRAAFNNALRNGINGLNRSEYRATIVGHSYRPPEKTSPP